MMLTSFGYTWSTMAHTPPAAGTHVPSIARST